MQQFSARHDSQIKSVLSGPDRVIFQGTMRQLFISNMLEAFLNVKGVWFKDFGAFAESKTAEVQQFARGFAKAHQRPYIYLPSFRTSKEQRVDEVAAESRVREGLICVLGCVESCQTPKIVKTKKGPRFVMSERRGLAVYFYFEDREFGRMYVRLQTWWPFPIQIYVNGRSYLARQLEREGIGFRQQDNCITDVDDWERAQQLLDHFTRRKWARTLNAFARRLNPLFGSLLEDQEYYWTTAQSEHATDVVFRGSAAQRLYPHLVKHALLKMESGDILRYFGVPPRPNRRKNVQSHLLRLEGGVRVKHRFEKNTLKIYNKTPHLIRIETTINDPYMWTIRRPDTKNGRAQLRKGIADFHAREQIARAINGRYLDALSVVGDEAPTANVLDPVTLPADDGRRQRGLHPTEPDDVEVLRFLLDAGAAAPGFRNRHLTRHLHPEEFDDHDKRHRLSARSSRKLRLLRAHGLIRKAVGKHLYFVTALGHRVATAALSARAAPISAVM